MAVNDNKQEKIQAQHLISYSNAREAWLDAAKKHYDYYMQQGQTNTRLQQIARDLYDKAVTAENAFITHEGAIALTYLKENHPISDLRDKMITSMHLVVAQRDYIQAEDACKKDPRNLDLQRALLNAKDTFDKSYLKAHRGATPNEAKQARDAVYPKVKAYSSNPSL